MANTPIIWVILVNEELELADNAIKTKISVATGCEPHFKCLQIKTQLPDRTNEFDCESELLVRELPNRRSGGMAGGGGLGRRLWGAGIYIYRRPLSCHRCHMQPFSPAKKPGKKN